MDLLKILDTKPVPAIVDARILSASNNTSGDYWLPTTMCLYQKELTDQIVSLHYSDILRYFETKDYKDDVVIHSMETMCLNSGYVATHPYLLIDHHSPKSLITKDIPGNLAETSGKFTVLRDLISLVQEYETNTAIACRPGRTMDLLEALLLANKVNIKRYDGHSIKSKQKIKNFSCTCHLFPSEGLDLVKYPIEVENPFDMLICLDTSVNTNDSNIQKVLQHARYPDTVDFRAPIVRLVAINSVDHCQVYFEKLYGKLTREFLENVTAAVVVLRDRVGTLPPDLRPIYAQKVRYLRGWLEDPSIPWPLPDLYPIKKYTPMDVEKSLLTEVHYSQVEDELEAAFSTGKKRVRTRDEKKNIKAVESKSFYDIKRLKNDYFTNPIKQDMGRITGIENSVVISNNYHLSTGIITHKLIQSIGQTYLYLKLQCQEMAFYKNLNDIQEGRKNVYHDEEIAIEKKFKDVNSRHLENLNSSMALESSNQNKLEAISMKEKELNGLLEILAGNPDKYQNMKELFLEHSHLENEISKEERLSSSKKMEREYMEKEIERATKAMQEMETEMKAKTSEAEALQKQLFQVAENNNYQRDEVLKRIMNLKSQLTAESSSHADLEGKFGVITEKLSKMQTSRVRFANNKGGNGRRVK